MSIACNKDLQKDYPPYRLFPSAMSYFPALFTTPDSLVSFSEKCGELGTLTSIRSNGKYSLEGKPAPREINPNRHQPNVPVSSS